MRSLIRTRRPSAVNQGSTSSATSFPALTNDGRREKIRLHWTKSKGAMMGDRRFATFFYRSFMDDKIFKQLGVVAERSEVAVFVLRHHTRMIANQNGSVYSTRCSTAYAVYREDQWQRRSKHTELES
jgi:hypothetical protein